MVDRFLPTSQKEAKEGVGYFQEVPTTDNLIAFKRAKALARRIRRQCQRESWIKYVSSIPSSTTSQQLWRKVKAANGLYREFNIPILETSTALFSSPLDVASLIGKTFASVSSSESYSPAFQATKNRLERTPINFRCRQPLPYKCDFDMFELKRALSSAHNTSPGPDGISYVLLRHLSEDSLVSLLYLFNRIWREQVYPTQWQEAIVIPILKPGKDPKNPLSYRPIALTSCLCKTLERMVNARLVYHKSTVAPVVFQRVFAYHRSQYSRYSAIYTDGLKRADYVGCGVVIEDIMHGYKLDTSCSIFTAEAVAIYRALHLIGSTMPRKYCIYTDSMSVLEALENYHDRCHPVVCTILDITSRLYSKGFDIVFCWLPSHVGIIGNEQADSAAKSATTHLPLAVPLSDMKRVIMHHIFKIWQESWSQQLDNKLHSVKPVIGAWPVMPMRRTDVKLTRLRIGHTRFTHRHLLFGERAPESPQLSQTYAKVAKSPTAPSTTQTVENITQIKCPPLQLLQHLLSVPQPNKYPSITSVSTSSSTTQANLLSSASSIKPTTEIESRLPEPISSGAAPDNSLNTSTSTLSAEIRPFTRSNKSAARARLSTEIQPLPESDPTASIGEHFNAPKVPQCAKRNSRNRRKCPKVQKAEIKIKMAPHRPRKSTPTELTTDEEDKIMYDV
ncbi:RNase H domain-containing protein [Trichonephila clavipes]|nr:RNase H domain-containing protein [Trichonephila clavipes]